MIPLNADVMRFCAHAFVVNLYSVQNSYLQNSIITQIGRKLSGLAESRFHHFGPLATAHCIYISKRHDDIIVELSIVYSKKN